MTDHDDDGRRPAATSGHGSAEQGKATTLLEAKGLPGTRAALQAFLDAPLEPHLIGRKWCVPSSPSGNAVTRGRKYNIAWVLRRIPDFAGLDDENWVQLCESNPQGTVSRTHARTNKSKE
jgi:hypothetical protein